MAGVWMFEKNGLMRLEPNPLPHGRKVFVHCASNRRIETYEELEEKLRVLGWVPYTGGNTSMRQYHQKTSSTDLITLPPDFESFKTVHMYDIVVKTRSAFEVRDA